MKTKTIHQTVTFACTPHEFYEIIMDSKKHMLHMGDPAKISRQVGGTFMAAGGYINGKNLELVKDKKIVQSWRGSDFPKGHMSTVTFELKKVPSGTRVLFTHEGVPEKLYKNINTGWKTFYWNKIKLRLKLTKKPVRKSVVKKPVVKKPAAKK